MKQVVEVGHALLFVHNSTVALVPVHKDEEEATRESIVDATDANAPTPILLARSSRKLHIPMDYSKNKKHPPHSFSKLFQWLTSASAKDMVANYWVAPEAIQLKLLVALANMR